ncbi:unnamed protein product [Toxocara canis]|uniref:DUF5641 domain-containing protein n=1 Tax=Toxocara canis TaxID=6265 RepID=A0A183TW43_TOXCA|nr:unnamed protein product [Toxocara canis]
MSEIDLTETRHKNQSREECSISLRTRRTESGGRGSRGLRPEELAPDNSPDQTGLTNGPDVASDDTTVGSTVYAIHEGQHPPHCVFSADRFSSRNRLLSAATTALGFLRKIEGAPWRGGIYDRMVQTTKKALRRMIGRAPVDDELLQTLLRKCEAIANPRSLTYSHCNHRSGTKQDNRSRCESGSRRGQRSECYPTIKNRDKLLDAWSESNKSVERFWKVWETQHLLALRERSQRQHRAPRPVNAAEPRAGQVVLIHDESKPRALWKLGIITKLIEGRDGKNRPAELQCDSQQKINRPPNLIFPLKISASDASSSEPQEPGNPERHEDVNSGNSKPTSFTEDSLTVPKHASTI